MKRSYHRTLTVPDAQASLMCAQRFGVSLLECCLVIALIACIAKIGISHLSFLYKLQVQSEIERLHATICALQQQSITTNAEKTLTIDDDQNSYSYNGSTHKLPISLQFGFPKGALGPPSSASNPISKICSFTNNAIIFWPNGMIKSGTIYITDKKKQYAYALSNAVGSVSFLRIYEYRKGKWFCRS